MSHTLQVILIAGAAALLLHVMMCAVMADYGRVRGYPGIPIFIATFFLFFPIVLLAITIARPIPQAAPEPLTKVHGWR